MTDLLKQNIIRIKIQAKKNLFIFKISADYNEDSILNTIAEKLMYEPCIIVLDGNSITDKKFIKLCDKIKLLTEEFESTLLIKNRADIAFTVEADGIITDKNSLAPHQIKHLLSDNALIGYLQAGEISNASEADFVIINEENLSDTNIKYIIKEINDNIIRAELI